MSSPSPFSSKGLASPKTPTAASTEPMEEDDDDLARDFRDEDEAEAGGEAGRGEKPSKRVLAAASAKPLSLVEDTTSLDFVASLAQFTPLRLTDEEHVMLRVMEGALDHSEFTNNVDVSSNMHYVREVWDKDERVRAEISEMCGVIVGLSVANDVGDKNLLHRSLDENFDYLIRCFEVARRFKILNPDKMRSNYGKLMYMLMDAVRPRSRDHGLDKLVTPVRTVGELVRTKNAAALFSDPALVDATREVTETGSAGASAARQKQRAVQYLVDRYAPASTASASASASASTSAGGGNLTPDDLRRVLSSLEDARSFLRSNRDPVEKMLQYLHRFFDPRRPDSDPTFTLDLRGRSTKPRHMLTHDHRTQFTFVKQSLILWRRVMAFIYRLWIGVEEDLLSPRNGYQLSNTGQGMQRCQNAPRTRENMNSVLNMVQRECGEGWVGLSVVHLGDREVPNALVFMDKYLQVPRILSPIVRCLEAVEGELANDPHARKYIDSTFGSPEQCVRYILADLFRHGFDGGGDLGGSCIDGRLTSLWNYTTFIEKKPYYGVFLLSGFLSF